MRPPSRRSLDGKQVAFLAPTTVLAFQHLKTLRIGLLASRLAIDMVSRFRTKQETKEVLERLASGRVDIIVGTHRLLSKDVRFKDLGLLVVDEEQRFGVVHKERIKQMRKRVDVLTMTATPIPPNVEHVSRRHSRHVDHRDAAQGSAIDSDQCRQVRRTGD